MKRRIAAGIALALALPAVSGSQTTPTFTRADTLRGSNTAERAWWDAAFYDLHVKVNPVDENFYITAEDLLKPAMDSAAVPKTP